MTLAWTLGSDLPPRLSRESFSITATATATALITLVSAPTDTGYALIAPASDPRTTAFTPTATGAPLLTLLLPLQLL